MARVVWITLLAWGLCPALGTAQETADPLPEAAEPAPEAPSNDARAHFERGRTAYELGRYQEALDAWLEAYRLDPRPLLQLNIAQARERLGHLSGAVEALESYLQHAEADDPNRPQAEARRMALRERLSHTGIRLRGGPSGAQIAIDGDDWGLTPRPDAIAVTPGTHEIVVRSEGYEPFRSTVSVPEGQAVDIQIIMSEANEVAPAGPGVAPWIVVGTGAALVVGAGVLGGLALSQASDAEPGSSEADTAKTLALTADILGATGLAAVAGGLIWYFVARPGDEETAALQITPVAAPGEAGLQASVTF